MNRAARGVPSKPLKKVAVIGSGVVGQTLADGFLKHGYEVIRATRDLSKLPTSIFVF